ncbi:MAG: PAS domain S-box protein [Myxococcales bacterium]|nr:PAS domain S-box protein [Myxococcales bacterium]
MLSVDMLRTAGVGDYFRPLNPAWQRVLGYEPEELLRRPFWEFIHPEDLASTRAELENLKLGLTTYKFDNRYRWKDGSCRWISWTC